MKETYTIGSGRRDLTIAGTKVFVNPREAAIRGTVVYLGESDSTVVVRDDKGSFHNVCIGDLKEDVELSDKVRFNLHVSDSGYIHYGLHFPIPEIDFGPGDIFGGLFNIGNDPYTPAGNTAFKIVCDVGDGLEEHENVTTDKFLRLLATAMGYNLVRKTKPDGSPVTVVK